MVLLGRREIRDVHRGIQDWHALSPAVSNQRDGVEPSPFCAAAHEIRERADERDLLGCEPVCCRGDWPDFGDRPTIHGDDDGLSRLMHRADDLRQLRFDLGERLNVPNDL